jgi:hypothetical protein
MRPAGIVILVRIVCKNILIISDHNATKFATLWQWSNLEIHNVNYILKTTDPLPVEEILADIFLPDDGRTTETCSSLSNNK